MKNMIKLLCLLLAALFVFAGCGTPADQPDTDDSAAGTSVSADVSDTADTTDGDDDGEDELQIIPWDPSADTRRGTAVNVDCDAIWYMYAHFGQKLDNLEQMCVDWFDLRYKDGYVSDLMYNVDQHTPSETRQSYMDFYLEAQQTGEKLDDVTQRHGELLNRVYNEHKVDPYQIWFDLCYENDINPWLSFRMNDTHAPTLGYACTDFYYEAKDNGWLISSNGKNGWSGTYPHCLDYSVPEVREYFLVYIDEMLGRYDAYGIELDWQREIHCFKTDSADNCKYMDIFMKDLNEIVAKYEKQYGHEIKIAARLARDLESNKGFGFDLVNWAKNDWIDVVIPASHGPTDSGVPVPEWKAAMDAYDVEVYVGFESVTLSSKYAQTDTTLAAFTSMYLQQGADKIQLFNLFNASKGFYSVCSSLEDATKYAKRSYIITSQTKVPKISGISTYEPLPLNVLKGKVTDPIELNHGRLVTKWDSYVYLGISNKKLEKLEEANLKVYYNGIECEYKGKAFRAHGGVFGEYDCVVSFLIPKEAWVNSESAEITFTADDYVKISYVELMNGHPSIG